MGGSWPTTMRRDEFVAPDPSAAESAASRLGMTAGAMAEIENAFASGGPVSEIANAARRAFKEGVTEVRSIEANQDKARADSIVQQAINSKITDSTHLEAEIAANTDPLYTDPLEVKKQVREGIKAKAIENFRADKTGTRQKNRLIALRSELTDQANAGLISHDSIDGIVEEALTAQGQKAQEIITKLEGGTLTEAEATQVAASYSPEIQDRITQAINDRTDNAKREKANRDAAEVLAARGNDKIKGLSKRLGDEIISSYDKTLTQDMDKEIRDAITRLAQEGVTISPNEETALTSLLQDRLRAFDEIRKDSLYGSKNLGYDKIIEKINKDKTLNTADRVNAQKALKALQALETTSGELLTAEEEGVKAQKELLRAKQFENQMEKLKGTLKRIAPFAAGAALGLGGVALPGPGIISQLGYTLIAGSVVGAIGREGYAQYLGKAKVKNKELDAGIQQLNIELIKQDAAFQETILEDARNKLQAGKGRTDILTSLISKSTGMPIEQIAEDVQRAFGTYENAKLARFLDADNFGLALAA